MKHKYLHIFYDQDVPYMLMPINRRSKFDPLKGQLQGQQERGERGECSLAAFDPSNKRIRTKNIFKIYMENFNFSFFFFLLTITIHI